MATHQQLVPGSFSMKTMVAKSMRFSATGSPVAAMTTHSRIHALGSATLLAVLYARPAVFSVVV